MREAAVLYLILSPILVAAGAPMWVWLFGAVAAGTIALSWPDCR